MLKNYPFNQIRDKLSTSQKILIVLPANPNFDAVASALSLRLALIEGSKNTIIYCPQPMTVEFNHLVGVDQIGQKLQGSDMIITLNYPVDQIERVSYNDDNGQPNIVIQPKNGAPQLSENITNYHFAGVGADLVFTIGVSDLMAVGDPANFQNAAIVDINFESQGIGREAITVVDPTASSLSEIILGLISGLSLPVGPDTAQNLLDGLWRATNGLSGVTAGADTYEAVSICLRIGARKPVSQPLDTVPTHLSQGNLVKPKTQNIPSPLPSTDSDIMPPVNRDISKKNPPTDWLQPKIYRGTSTV